MLAHVEDGRVTRLEGDPAHPSSRGFICVRGRAYHEFVYHPDRLRHPLKRAGAKAGGKWQRISWEQALGEIAAALTVVREKYGAEANAVFRGTGPRMANYSTRLLAYAMGSPNEISTDLHICYTPSSIADIHTVGQCITQDVGPDYISPLAASWYVALTRWSPTRRGE